MSEKPFFIIAKTDTPSEDVWLNPQQEEFLQHIAPLFVDDPLWEDADAMDRYLLWTALNDKFVQPFVEGVCH